MVGGDVAAGVCGGDVGDTGELGGGVYGLGGVREVEVVAQPGGSGGGTVGGGGAALVYGVDEVGFHGVGLADEGVQGV